MRPGLTDYRAALAVIDAASRADSLEQFREATLDAFAREFGYRNLTFFIGERVAEAYLDRRPYVTGRAERMLPLYIGQYHDHDPFARPSTSAILARRSAVGLNEIPGPQTREEQRYLHEFLHLNGIRDKLVVRLDGGAAGGAVIGILDTHDGRFRAADHVRADLLSTALGSLLRFHLRPDRRARGTVALSPRERQVAELVAEGLSNRQVARALFISEETVKKHLTRVLAASDCANRTQLAVAWSALSVTTAEPAAADRG